MMQVIGAAMTRAHQSAAGRYWDKLGILIDCAVPLALASAAALALIAAIFNLVH